MRFKEFVQKDTHQLDEINLKQAVAAGIIGAASLGFGGKVHAQHMSPKEQYKHDLSQSIAQYYRVDGDMVKRVVELAHKYENKVWPKAKDLIALTGVESSFNPNAKSGLKKDPALGLLQVRPGVWKINPSQLADMENQIKYGSDILSFYYKKFKGDKDAALSAYNIGETAYRKFGDRPEYLQKYYNELQRQHAARLNYKIDRLQALKQKR